MIDHLQMKLGMRPMRHDPRTLKLSKYLLDTLPDPPAELDYVATAGAGPEMYGNDQAGDCTCAGAGNLIKIWTANAGDPLDPTTDEILAAYEALSGYDPATGDNDNGCDPLDVLNYWRQTGIAGHKIGAYAQVDIKNHKEVMQAIQIFGGIYCGLNMPTAWQNESLWDAPRGMFATITDSAPTTGSTPSASLGQASSPQAGSGRGSVPRKKYFGDWAPGSWGGHMVCSGKYDQNLYLCTWGTVQPMTWAAGDEYGDGWFAIISPDWLNPDSGKACNGLDLGALTKDLEEITNNELRMGNAGNHV